MNDSEPGPPGGAAGLPAGPSTASLQPAHTGSADNQQSAAGSGTSLSREAQSGPVFDDYRPTEVFREIADRPLTDQERFSLAVYGYTHAKETEIARIRAERDAANAECERLRQRVETSQNQTSNTREEVAELRGRVDTLEGDRLVTVLLNALGGVLAAIGADHLHSDSGSGVPLIAVAIVLLASPFYLRLIRGKGK